VRILLYYHKYIQNDDVGVDILITTGSASLYNPCPPLIKLVTIDITTAVCSSCITCDSEAEVAVDVIDIPLEYLFGQCRRE